MFNLAFVFDDAIHAMTKYADHLTVIPLPATVYLMQVDVINQYWLALQHYFTFTLNEPYLQNSSLGTPYQKWAHFTNEDFDMLSFTVHNLLRYTSRLIHETECNALSKERRHSERADKSNSYTEPLWDLRSSKKAIGIRVMEDNRLIVTAFQDEGVQEKVISETLAGGPTYYYRLITGDDGKEYHQPIEAEEFARAAAAIKSENLDISDRSQLQTLKKQGLQELTELRLRNHDFGELCNAFYQRRKTAVAQPFENYIASYWT